MPPPPKKKKVGGPVGVRRVRWGGGGPVRGGTTVGGMGVCVRIIEVIVKCKKKSRGRGFGRGGGSSRGWGGWLVAKFGLVGDVQYWGCKPRIEGIVK